MEADDDMIVLVVVDDNEGGKTSGKTSSICSEDHLVIEDILATAEKHGEYIKIKTEPEYLDEDANIEIKQENIEDKFVYNDDSDYIPDDTLQDEDNYLSDSSPNGHRVSMVKPWQQRSFVEELRQQYDEFCDNEELLTTALEQIMRSVKPPPPPRDFYIMNGIMLECLECSVLSESISAATRHYHEKHGERYLVCFACGVDFRSPTNLYKHEKRCLAPDAHIVLKARAGAVGRKGRSRPYLTISNFDTESAKTQMKFPCNQCSAVFTTRLTLESHENLHRGERPFRCRSCPCAYTSQSALTRHTKKHMDIQFMCDHCSRTFKVKAALVAHMDTHNPTRKFGCSECSRRFAQRAALRLHVDRDHRHLPPPCACQICTKRYPRMSLLKIHMKKAHGMSIITRKMFFKALPTMTEQEIKNSQIVLKTVDKFLDTDRRFAIYNHDQCKPNEQTRNIEKDSNVKQSVKQEQNDIPQDDINIQIQDNDEIDTENLAELINQYVRNGQDLGKNVIYIQNGEIIQMEGDSTQNLVFSNIV